MMANLSNNTNIDADKTLIERKEDSNSLNAEESYPGELKLYKRRWIIVFLYGLCTASSSFQWIQYGIINNIISRYKLICFMKLTKILKLGSLLVIAAY